MTEFVYFIQGKETGRIKIGTSQDPEKRIKSMQLPEPVRILHIQPGGRELESKLHKKFQHLHVHGEWFMDSPDQEILKTTNYFARASESLISGRNAYTQNGWNGWAFDGDTFTLFHDSPFSDEIDLENLNAAKDMLLRIFETVKYLHFLGHEDIHSIIGGLTIALYDIFDPICRGSFTVFPTIKSAKHANDFIRSKLMSTKNKDPYL